MAATLAGPTINTNFGGTWNDNAILSSSPSGSLSIPLGSPQWGVGNTGGTAGSVAGKVDGMYVASRQVASSGSPDAVALDVGLAGLFNGQTNSFSHGAAVFIQNYDGTNSLYVTQTKTNGMTWGLLGGNTGAVITLGPGAVTIGAITGFVAYAGDWIMLGSALVSQAIGSTTQNQIQVSSSGGTNVNYGIGIFGRSA